MYMKLQDRFQQSAVATAWVFSLFTTFLHMMGKSTSKPKSYKCASLHQHHIHTDDA
ncbi:hypothetical protein DPMN_069204 [Dreissena polymorpha]|uniref:Uncharacterized protein n=1 Tax=Dreissena polymorpha TaxID=45954 RepID=A0A9D3YYN4_DREPO|nr:hypothetical protein DPMN_069204 [Dreissena polymorpha]